MSGASITLSLARIFGRNSPPTRDTTGINGELLYARLRVLMETSAVYADPDITRARLASMLGTNENYLHRAIRIHTGHSFSGYINSLRMGRACELLTTRDQRRTIARVARDCGFGSGNTFHRRFRDRYGITPGEFRRLSPKAQAALVQGKPHI